MASTYFTNSDLTMLQTLLSTLAEDEAPHGSLEHRELVHFLIRKFQAGDRTDSQLRFQLSRHRARNRAMISSLALWGNEGGALPAFNYCHAMQKNR